MKARALTHAKWRGERNSKTRAQESMRPSQRISFRPMKLDDTIFTS